MLMIIKLDNKNFKNAIKNGIKVVEFYMPECPYCIRQNEVLNDLGNIWLGQVSSKNSQDLIKLPSGWIYNLSISKYKNGQSALEIKKSAEKSASNRLKTTLPQSVYSGF